MADLTTSDATLDDEPTHHVLLVPGFFGFAKFGELEYFSGVARAITSSFERMGKRAVVSQVATLPTSSIRRRAALVLEAIAAVAASGTGPIHIVGHSTGGLDARLAIAPTASLPTEVHFDQYERIHTLVTVCCPHFGTPVATFFTSAMGKPLLRIFARYFMWLLRRRLALAVVLRIGYLIVRIRDPFRRHRSAFDELYEKLLRDLSEPRRLALIEFLDAVSSDQSLLFQLTPAGCDVLNACTADPQLRYGSVVARARPATWKLLFKSIVHLYSQIVYPIYAVLRFIAARGESKWIPPPAESQRVALERFYGDVPGTSDSDGVVPTRSQLWGEVVHATRADHLDVVGLYGPPDPDGAADWIPSYSGFERANFEALWHDVGRFLAFDETAAPVAQLKVGTERTEQDLHPGAADPRKRSRHSFTQAANRRQPGGMHAEAVVPFRGGVTWGKLAIDSGSARAPWPSLRASVRRAARLPPWDRRRPNASRAPRWTRVFLRRKGPRRSIWSPRREPRAHRARAG